MSRQRKPIPKIPNTRFPIVKPSTFDDKVSNKVSNLMNYTDNLKVLPDLHDKIMTDFRDSVLDFIGEKNYIIEIIKKNTSMKEKLSDKIILPINTSGLIELQSWILDVKLDQGPYEESITNFGDYELHKGNLKLEFIEIVEKKKKGNKFFPNILTKNYDLSKLQIYKSIEEAENSYDTHCFVHACEMNGIKKDTLIRLKHLLHGKPILNKDFPIMCDILESNIRIKKYPEGANNNKILKIPSSKKFQIIANKKPVLNFVSYNTHIMADIKLPISSYSIKNYDSVKHLPNFQYIIKYIPKIQKYARNYKIETSTSIIMKHLIETQSFAYSREMCKVGKNIKLHANEVSGDLDLEQRYFRQTKRKNVPIDSIYFGDLESLTNEHVTENENHEYGKITNHRNFMAGYVPNKSKDPYIFRAKTRNQVNHQTPIYEMFDHIMDNNSNVFDIENDKGLIEAQTLPYIIYFHNLKYDFTFIKKMNIRFISICEKSGSIYSVEFLHRGARFLLKDSLKILPFALNQFKKKLNLDVGKADFEMYDYFTDDNMNLDEEIYYKNKKIKPLTTYIEYLKLDVITLKAGVNKLYNSLKSFDSYINVFNFLTISSLAFDYFGYKGGWDGLCEVSGSTLNLISQSNVGGRCFAKDNKKIVCNPTEEDLEFLKQGLNYTKEEVLIILDMILEDFDMKSCYPSAIKISKFPKGKAKKLYDTHIKEINEYYRLLLEESSEHNDYFKYIEEKYSHIIFEVKITFNGYIQVPILSVKKENGSRLWTNEINEPVTISGVYLKDMIDHKYYKITNIKVLNGIYWNEGFNTKCQEIIQLLYNERAEYKNKKNPKYNMCMSECLKLILNSIYGKCGLRASNNKINIMTKEEYERHLVNNFDDLVYIKSLNSQNYEVKTKQNTYKHFNMTHISSLILENSKILMNHVAKVCENIDLTILYSDTDSYHLEKAKIPLLCSEYKKIFGVDLIGTDLCQFDVDFNPVYVKGVEHKQYSKKFLCPGLKWYMDDLTYDGQPKNDLPNKHIRNKGCDTINLNHYCKDNNMTITELYLSFIRGDTCMIDLCKGKVRFEFKNYNVKCKETMLKEFKF